MRLDIRNLAAFQRDFLQTIQAPVSNDSAALNIYRDTFFYGLLNTLLETYAFTCKALGDEVFKAFGRDYVRTHPLTSGDRNIYGMGFPDFLRDHTHLGDRLWLPCLARFEWAIQHAHNAPDEISATLEVLLDPRSRVGLHPSARVIATFYDVKVLYTALTDNKPAPQARAIVCQLLVGRTPQDDVVWLCLEPMEAEFVGLISLYGSLASALDDLGPDDDDMAVLQTLLARLVKHGLLIALQDPST